MLHCSRQQLRPWSLCSSAADISEGFGAYAALQQTAVGSLIVDAVLQQTAVWS